MTPTHINKLLCALALLIPAAGWALSSDRTQPLQIDADQVEFDQQQGISTYRGSVHLTRGSMQLFADQVVVHHSGKAVQLITATGAPVNYLQRSDRNQEIRARALRMEYHADSGELVLFKQAELHQDANVFTSERIVYDSVADRVNAGAAAAAPQERVHITIQPAAPPTAPAAPQ